MSEEKPKTSSEKKEKDLEKEIEKQVAEEVKQYKFLENHRREIMRHIDGVRKNTILLGERIIDMGGEENERFGRQLIANGYIHDNSKLYGVEWKYLIRGNEYISMAHEQHVSTNPHHPEYWPGGIKEMPEIYIAEMVCDWKARSSEKGTGFIEYIKEVNLPRFGVTTKMAVYRKIKKYVDLLLDDKFEPLPNS
jgi:hypothetical protein